MNQRGKKVMITVQTTQTDSYGQTEKMEFHSVGQQHIKNNSIYLIYKESRVSGLADTTTSLRIEPQRVTLNRMGQTQMKLVFVEGTNHQTTYATPYGNMGAEVFTNKVRVDLTEHGGSINLEYELILEREKIGDNKLLITFKEA